nr:hypothetical protein [Tanacetum cinerariifolium]
MRHYQAWERYNDLPYKCPTHDLNIHQKVNIFYKGLDTMTHQLLDSQGPTPNKTPDQALEAIQTMVNHLQKWHDESNSRKVSNGSSDGIAAIANKLDNLGHNMKKLKENMHDIQTKPRGTNEQAPRGVDTEKSRHGRLDEEASRKDRFTAALSIGIAQTSAYSKLDTYKVWETLQGFYSREVGLSALDMSLG